MSITAQRKSELIKKYCKKDNDTGSPEVQISILTERVKNLTEHIKIHIHDFHSRRGLLMLVGKRRRLMHYLKTNNTSRYEKIKTSLGIRR